MFYLFLEDHGNPGEIDHPKPEQIDHLKGWRKLIKFAGEDYSVQC